MESHQIVEVENPGLWGKRGTDVRPLDQGNDASIPNGRRQEFEVADL